MLGHKEIYTEKIHHLRCVKCKDSINTNDTSHEMNKIEAAIWFEEQGWKYILCIGWCCEECKPVI